MEVEGEIKKIVSKSPCGPYLRLHTWKLHALAVVGIVSLYLRGFD